ncbi:hypothetical protein FHS59_002742 [Algoriphagus iocasae]|uniref:Uncharacterized protein n=1 Tax=Algoriphagus iocasae TaxID=1836499 RepID=A0A841MR04_9BACT|nr:hypothetical protein [Algoriphagus iocasae]MBB6327114.1 hypothetical protein [Algoriphagus iocasae]
MEKLQTRLIEQTLKGKPESLKKMAMSQFKRMSFTTEDEFLEFLDDLGSSGEDSKGKKEFKGLKVEPDKEVVKEVVAHMMK